MKRGGGGGAEGARARGGGGALDLIGHVTGSYNSHVLMLSSVYAGTGGC